MSRLYALNRKSGWIAVAGTLLSFVLFCLALVILPVLLLVAAGVLLALSVFGRRYLRQYVTRMRHYQQHVRKRDIYDADPHIRRETQPKNTGRVFEHQD